MACDKDWFSVEVTIELGLPAPSPHPPHPCLSHSHLVGTDQGLYRQVVLYQLAGLGAT